MTTINRSALVQYSADQMFDLVNDIDNYPMFMRGCKSARVISRTEDELIGELVLAKAGIEQTLITRNKLTPGRRMDMQLEQGAFRRFEGRWEFEPLSETACKVTLKMNFELSSSILDFALEKFFKSSADNLVEALVKRAGEVYG